MKTRTHSLIHNHWKSRRANDLQPLETSLRTLLNMCIMGSAMHFLCAKRLQCCLMSLLPSSLSYWALLLCTFTCSNFCVKYHIFNNFPWNLCMRFSLRSTLKYVFHGEVMAVVGKSKTADILCASHPYNTHTQHLQFMNKNIRLYYFRYINILLNITYCCGRFH